MLKAKSKAIGGRPRVDRKVPPMSRVVVSNLVSVDGFFEGPNGELDWHVVEEEFFDYAKALLRSAGSLLFGRRTYEHMATHWPAAPSDEIADRMNALPKIVSSLLRAGLIDEYRMIVNPVILGRGKPQFRDIPERIGLRLNKTKALRSGVIILYYEIDGREAGNG